MRPLLPRPGPPAAAPASATSDSSSVPAITKTLTACNECRQKKTKAKSTCVYSSDSIVAQNQLKRQHKELAEELRLQKELFNILRTRKLHDATAVFHRLRAGESVESLVKFIQHGDLLLEVRLPTATQMRYAFPMLPPSSLPPCLEDEQNPYVRSLLYYKTFSDQRRSNVLPIDPTWRALPAYEKRYEWPYHAAELFEPEINNVHAASWTSVTDSDDLVQALLKSYLYYDYPFIAVFHKGYFLKDMIAGKKQYCSSLLVNAILACACHSHRIPGSSTDFWNPRELRYQFLAEARRLWEREQSRNHIASVQAAAIISYVLNCDGVDKVGFQYLQQSIRMAHAMDIFNQYKVVADSTKQAVYLTTAWALYGLHAIQTFQTRQAPVFFETPANFLVDVPSQDFIAEIQVKYPQQTENVPLYHSLVFSALCRLMVIMHDVVRRSYGAGRRAGPITLGEALQYRERLLAWEQSLPAALQSSSIACPVHIKLHMQYHILIIFLFDRFNQANDARSQIYRPEDRTRARTIAVAAWSCLESLVYIYYARHGFEACDPLVMSCLQLVGFAAVKDLATFTGHMRTSRLATVILCAKGLREQAYHYYLAEVVFALLRDSLSPPDAQHLRQFAHIDNEDKRKRYMAEHVSSHYVLTTTDGHDETQNGRLEELLKAYQNLDLEDYADNYEGTDGSGYETMEGVDYSDRESSHATSRSSS
ncbi:hypothetical protein G7054_g37 [Neopestalotiopsis clavispora]|nr:hypothetical protein G7054_g37 [Neopestalotiopsis clavispora]